MSADESANSDSVTSRLRNWNEARSKMNAIPINTCDAINVSTASAYHPMRHMTHKHEDGPPSRIRTYDQPIKSRMLYQLSYGRIYCEPDLIHEVRPPKYTMIYFLVMI